PMYGHITRLWMFLLFHVAMSGCVAWSLPSNLWKLWLEGCQLWQVTFRHCERLWNRECLVSYFPRRSEDHTSELQSRFDFVCRLLLEKKNLYTLYHIACDPVLFTCISHLSINLLNNNINIR